MFACLQVQKDPFYKKQLKEILKQEYEAKLEDNYKTASPLRLNNSCIKAIIFNTIMEVILYTYTIKKDDASVPHQ